MHALGTIQDKGAGLRLAATRSVPKLGFRNGSRLEFLTLSWGSAVTIRQVASAGLNCFEYGLTAGGVLQARPQPTSGFLLLMGIEGSSRVECGGDSGLIGPGQIELRLANAPMTISGGLGARGLAVLIPRNKLKLRGALACAGRRTALRQDRPVNLDSNDGSLTAKLLHDCLAGIATRISGGHSACQMERAGELVFVLLKETLSEARRSTQAPSGNSIPWYVATAERQMSQNVTSPVSIMELAQYAGVSPRTLHDGFRKHRGVSPMKLQRTQRMQLVREELSHPVETTSVTDTALKWGFNHLGRFSAYYLEEFGEKPSETLRLGRAKR